MTQLTLIATQQTTYASDMFDETARVINHVSHELRTPATAVKIYLNMLLDGHAGPLTKKQRAYLAQANSSNEQQIGVINQLLAAMKQR